MPCVGRFERGGQTFVVDWLSGVDWLRVGSSETRRAANGEVVVPAPGPLRQMATAVPIEYLGDGGWVDSGAHLVYLHPGYPELTHQYAVLSDLMWAETGGGRPVRLLDDAPLDRAAPMVAADIEWARRRLGSPRALEAVELMRQYMSRWWSHYLRR